MQKKDINIVLYVSELVYDIQNKTYLTGRSRSDGKNYEKVANMQANDDDESLNQIYRSIGNAFSTLKTKVSEYVDSLQTSGNNLLIDDDTQTLCIVLSMPTNYNQATVESIGSMFHQYIVNLSIADWFILTNKDDAKEYIANAALNLEQIREALNKRRRPIRRGVSAETRFSYQVATPVIEEIQPAGWKITCETEGATIHYTTDGTTPTRQSDTFVSIPDQVSFAPLGMVIKAIAVKDGMYDSDVAIHQF